ncbi:MAG: D-alanine--D-alanine ligase [Syntrophomonadaceae bacterium]|nr:D-alanine--D-alanine ligase [Syntrophomonadaceae bacterium]
MKVLVIMGGTSEEREVSLRSGKAVYNALKELGYNVQAFDLNDKNLGDIITIAPDVVFIALHGKNGEDGTVQGFLDLLGIPYTGSGVAASAIGMNKILTKKILCFEGMPTSEFVILKKEDFFSNQPEDLRSLLASIGIPMVVKASTQGSSIGVTIVKKEEDILDALKKAFSFDPEILVERFIDGTELTASVIGNNNPQVLPLIEITSENEFFDYEAKYTPGMCAHIIPARISEDVRERVTKLAAEVYKAVGCRGYARIDFIVDKKGQPYVLEINTIPGMTEMSLVPDAARAAGISFSELVDRILKLALNNE